MILFSGNDVVDLEPQRIKYDLFLSRKRKNKSILIIEDKFNIETVKIFA